MTVSENYWCTRSQATRPWTSSISLDMSLYNGMAQSRCVLLPPFRFTSADCLGYCRLEHIFIQTRYQSPDPHSLPLVFGIVCLPSSPCLALRIYVFQLIPFISGPTRIPQVNESLMSRHSVRNAFLLKLREIDEPKRIVSYSVLATSSR
jgi:hypothetical protein